MMTHALEAKLEKIVTQASRQKHIEDVILHVHRESDDFSWTGGSEELDGDTEFFIASTTKLATTALILRLVGEGRLSLDHTITSLLPGLQLEGLHVYQGRERTSQITVRHLLSQTSGIADYFQGKTQIGESLEKRISDGNDCAWDVRQALSWAKDIGASFPPGDRRKTLYSDTGYQLLGALIEHSCEMPYAAALRHFVIEPLGLKRTWLYEGEDERPVLPLRSGAKTIHIPRAMTSFGPDGGLVSTAPELCIFLQAFFHGRLFSQEQIPALLDFRRLFFPLEYGVGLMRYKLPWIFSPFRPLPALIGHSGLSGAFAFHAPDAGLYLTGTLNQIRKPSASFQMLTKVLSVL